MHGRILPEWCIPIPSSPELIFAHGVELLTVRLQEEAVVKPITGRLWAIAGGIDDLCAENFVGWCFRSPSWPYTVLTHGTRVASRPTSGRDCGDGRKGDLGDARGDDLDGRILIGGVPATQLAVLVIAHGVEAAVRLDEEAVVGIACDDLNDPGDNDLGGGSLIGGVPGTQLAVCCSYPWPIGCRPTCGKDCGSVACSDLDDTGCDDLGRGKYLFSGVPDTELAVLVIEPMAWRLPSDFRKRLW